MICPGDPDFVEVEYRSLWAIQKRSAGKCGALFFGIDRILHERFGLSKKYWEPDGCDRTKYG